MIATLRAIRLLMLRRIRLQPMRAVVAAVTIGAGVALVISIVIVRNSADESIDEAGRQLAGVTELRLVGATDRGGLDPSTVAAVEQVDGVSAVVPLVETVTMAVDAQGDDRPILILGVDCRVDRLVGPMTPGAVAPNPAGCTPEGLAALTGPPLISSSLQRGLGSGAAVRTDQGRVGLEGAPVLPQLDRLAGGRVAVFPLERAQQLFSRGGRYDVAYIDTAPGTDIAALKGRIEAAAGDSVGVLTAAEAPPGIGSVFTGVLPLFVLAALLALAVGGVLVHNTVALSMEERRRQLAVVGALGGTDRVLVAGTLIEAALLGLAGGGVGAAGGVAVATPILSVFSTFTEQAAGIPLRVQVTGTEIVVALLLGAVLAVAAAWRPARRSRRLDIAAELSARTAAEESRSRPLIRRTAICAAVMVVGLAACVIAGRDGALEPWQATMAPLAYVVAVVGLTLGMAGVAPLVVQWCSRFVRTRRATVQLALTNLSRDAARVGVMAVAIGSAVAIAFVTASFQQSVRRSVSDSLTQNVHGVLISSVKAGETANLGGQLSPDTAEALKALPGVDTVNRGATLLVGHRTADLILVDAFDRLYTDGFPVITGAVDVDGFASGEVIIGGGLAREEGLRPGDMVTLDTPTGHVQLPVQAVVYNGSLGGRNVAMSYDRMVEIYGPQPLTQIGVEPQPGVTAAELAQTVRAAQIDADVEVQTAAEKAAEIVDAVGQQLEVFWALQRGMLVLSFIAVVSTLLLVGLQRQREVGLLAAVGMRPRDLSLMIVAEAGVLSVIAVTIGLIGSVPMFFGLLLIGPVLLGFSDPFVLDVPAGVLWAAVGVAVAVLASMWPAWRTSRADVLEALRYE